MKKVNKSCLICFSTDNNLRQAITNLRFVLESIKGLESISIWSRLASALVDIQFDSYEHQVEETYLCNLYKYNREDDKYYENYMKYMTRFIYLYNILEFIAPQKGSNAQPDMPSFRKLIQRYSIDSYPIYTSKYLKKYITIIQKGLKLGYLQDTNIENFIATKKSESEISIAFYLLTNIRNLLAHGKMKIVPNPDFSGNYEESQYFSILFRTSTLILINYIHLFILNNFESFDSIEIEYYKEDYENFPLDEKFIDILKTNHLLKNSPLIKLGYLDEEDIFDEVNHYLITQ